MKNRIVSLIVVITTLLFGTQIIAYAAPSGGECGYNLSWTLDSGGTLSIRGTGDMPNWTSALDVPWNRSNTGIRKVEIQSGVTSIDSFAFYCCSNLKKVSIPSSVTKIGMSAFSGCSRLESITIPNSVTSIGEYAFSRCSSLISISIPRSVTSIGESPFSGCSSLTNIYVDKNNQYYSSENEVLFNKDKTTLIQYAIGKTDTQYTIPDGVINIGRSAFSECSLTNITIPDSVKEIGLNAFFCCDSLETVNIPYGVTSINGGMFHSCSSLTSVSIPSSVKSIDRFAFCCCSSLTSITIPESVTIIDGYQFSGCSSLENIYVDKNNQYYSSEGGNLFNKDKTVLIQYAVGKTDTQYTIPDSVKSIEYCAFYSCSNLKSVTIPSSVRGIAWCAFYDCSNLTSVNIPNGVTYIGDGAFMNCSSLTDVYYSGTEAEWREINIKRDNNCLTNAFIHYN